MADLGDLQPPSQPRRRAMTDAWINKVLAVVVVVGLIGVVVYERPRLAEERAQLVGQEVVEVQPDDDPGEQRDPLAGLEGGGDPTEGDAADGGPALEEYGVTSSHPEAVDVGMGVLEAGGNAVDAAIATAYALGVVEPFGSGVGGGGAMLVHEDGGQPLGYDYREVVPASGETPASDIGVPGFAAGMAYVHERHGSMDMADLIEPAAVFAEDGVAVTETLEQRLTDAAFRMPINQLPRHYPGGRPLQAGEVLRQPEYGEALRLIQEQGHEAVHGGEVGEAIAEAVNGIELSDLADYEIIEPEVAVGAFGDYDVIGAGPPVASTVIPQQLQILDHLEVADMDPDSAEYHHAVAQAWRLADADRVEHVGDPAFEDVPLQAMLDPGYTAEQAAQIPADAFAPVQGDQEAVTLETDTTHVTVVDREGTMVSMTNTLSNFFGSGLPVSGFFMNDQLKNFSTDPESVNYAAAGKRPRSFIAPMILARDDRPVLGLGSPGGRRIPNMVTQTVMRWAGFGEDLESAVLAPRFHLEREVLETEEQLDGGVRSTLADIGYEVTVDVPTDEYYGAVQALAIDHDAGTLEGMADPRREGDWASGS